MPARASGQSRDTERDANISTKPKDDDVKAVDDLLNP